MLTPPGFEELRSPHVAAPICITSLNETAFTPLDRVLLARVSCPECLGPICGGEQK